MTCEKCRGDGRVIGGLLVNGDGTPLLVDGKEQRAVGWGQCGACKGTGKRTIAVVEPPDLQTVIDSGYTPEDAAVIVAHERKKAERGEKPYGPNDPSIEWGTPTAAVVPDPPKPEADPIPVPSSAAFTIGQSVALIGGGPVMTTTALLGDEVVCEWPLFDPDGKPVGKESRPFAVASLKPVG